MTDRLLHLDRMPVQKTEKSNLMSIINILRYLTEIGPEARTEHLNH